MLFINFSTAFNTIIPQQLIQKLDSLGLFTSLCNWLLDFLTGRPQAVRVGSNSSSTIVLNTEAPQRCMLSPLLFTLLTHNCTQTHSSNFFFKFADDTTVVGFMNKDKTNDRSAVSRLALWCHHNNLSLNVAKTKGDSCGLQEISLPAFSSNHQWYCCGDGEQSSWVQPSQRTCPGERTQHHWSRKPTSDYTSSAS